jgi:geranylgeranyl pyrophosphate synthase
VTDVVLDPKTAPDHVSTWLEEVTSKIEAELARRFPGRDGNHDPGRLREAMAYAVCGPGKRLRPAITLAACRAVGGDESRGLCAAIAVEALHAYTLVHDDLPAMDDD